MLYFDRIDVSEVTDVSKLSASKESDISQYWYFLNKAFKLQPNVCNRCHDLLMMTMNLSDIGSDHRCIISGISKSEAINLMQNIDLTKKKRNILKHKNLLSHLLSNFNVW